MSVLKRLLITLIVSLLLILPCHAAQVLAFCNPSNPGVAALLPNLQGWSIIDTAIPPPSNPNWRAGIFKGTAGQFAPLEALPSGWIAICILTVGDSKWPELNDAIDPAKREIMNTWLGANNYNQIGENWTNGQTARHIMSVVFNNNFDLSEYGVW